MSSRTAAVILNYRTAADTILAVRSLQAADATLATIVVVDNASADASVDAFREHLAGVAILERPRNEGFADGCNAGISHALEAGADAVLLLNSDVIIPPDLPAALQRVLDADRRIGIVAPIVRCRHDPDLVESAGLSYHASSGRLRMIDHGTRIEALVSFGCRLVEAVTGCAMLVRREVFEAVGLLRGEYFFGFEDVDFCCRARAQGFLTACAGSTFVLHEGHRTIGRRAAARAYFATRNHLLLASRFPPDGSRLARRLRLANVLALNVAHVLTARDIPTVKGLAASIQGAKDFARGRLGPAGGPI
jgi:GT2 family glycosyltransferase